MTADEREIYFSAHQGDKYELYVAKRADSAAPFGAPSRLVISEYTLESDRAPVLSPNGLFLAFRRRTTERDIDIFMSARALPGAPFESAQVVETLGGLASDGPGSWSADMRTFYFDSGNDLYSVPVDEFGSFGSAVPLTELNWQERDSRIVVSHDGLTAYFQSTRPDTYGLSDIYTARRTTTSLSFSGVASLSEVNSAHRDIPFWISRDNCRLLYGTDRFSGESTDYDIYFAERDPRP